MFGIGTHIWLLVGKNLWLLEQIGLTKRGLIEMDIHSGNFNTESRSMNQAKKTEMKGRRERSVELRWVNRRCKGGVMLILD